ncbi:hypothetical protein LCGC14_0807930 [marine sediment metagenome]|uniref:Uncharacterized protein n=1 Tax=marine sediment metagenome TaxID=412755 RepID=A0A0F9PS79_9ZZZZ
MGTLKLNIIVKIISIIISNVSPELKNKLKISIQDLKAKAKETKNPFDDLLMEFVEAVLL